MPKVAIRKDPLLAYDVWRSMHKRCSDPKTNQYANYGGKGITVHPSWSSYEVFIADVGARPSPKHQLDRIDSSKGYCPENCRWVTAKENIRNSRVTKYVTFKDTTLALSDWASKLGISRSTLSERLRNWSLEKALTQPVGPTGPKQKGHYV